MEVTFKQKQSLKTDKMEENNYQYYQDGDILWDSSNEVLVEYNSSDNQYQNGTSVACPISLNDLIFKRVLKFENDQYGGFHFESIYIKFDPKEAGFLYSYNGQAICELQDIQHIARMEGIMLQIDKLELISILKKRL